MIFNLVCFILSGLIGTQIDQTIPLYNEVITLNQTKPSWGEVMSDSVGVNISYDNQNLYISLDAYQDTSTIVGFNSTRDNGSDQDFCGFIIDPLGTSQEGYMFLFGAGGNFLDARILKSTGGTEEYSWDSDVSYTAQRTDYGYRVDAIVPFSNFRRSGGQEQKWVINIIRKKQSTNETGLYGLTESRQANFLFRYGIETVIRGIGGREPIHVIPYGIWGGEIDDGVESEKGDAGFDARFPFGASSVVNLAFNPDFSQLEGDPLEFDFNARYVLYYSEYRPFFLEERGVFRSLREIFYSRRIYNPFLAARYTYKTEVNQFGFILASDENDTAIGNPDAYAGLLRYKRSFGVNYLGAMILGRQNRETEDLNYILMTDGDLNFFDEMIGANYTCAMSRTEKEEEDTTGYYYDTETSYKRGNFKLSIYNSGITRHYDNKLGYITEKDYQSLNVYFDYRLNLNRPVIKRIVFGFYPGASGSWDDFWGNLFDNYDSIEYSHAEYLEIDLFTSFVAYLYAHQEKTEYNGDYYCYQGVELGMNQDITPNMHVYAGGYTGYGIDYNYGRLCKKYSYWGGLSGNIFEKISYNFYIQAQQFYGDTSGYALKPSEIKNADWQWNSYKPVIQLTYTPDNRYSFTFTYQKLWADFAPYYWAPENYDLDEDKFFALLTFKPSTGDAVYFGVRFPEKLVFFKFTHRFEF
ncbi:hypothetical protein JXA84_04895 [candidate division WOR-3 bacterium]|nr:hypothetical protein [candidate division WOR-3 bacterium]